MPRVKLSEFRAKTIVNNHLKTGYSGFPFNADKDSIAKVEQTIKPDKRYVLKVDQGIKKRYKQGLIKLDLGNARQILDGISGLRKEGFGNFLIEEYIPHDDSEERYLALERTDRGTIVYYSQKGGVDIEDFQSDVRNDLIKDAEDIKKIAISLDLDPSILEKLVEVFDINYFSFLEINPLVISFKKPFLLDIAAEVDSAAEFFVDTWSGRDFREGKKNITPEEEHVAKLSEKSQASFKLVVLNPEGSIFMLLSGGGASIVLADEVYNLGFGKMLANYGEYSGNPNEEETLIYTKDILNLLVKSPAHDKVLMIGGGVANFTDVRITFRGIVRALEQFKDQLKEQNVKIFVRRGGPNLEDGLKMIKGFMDKNGISGEVYGPELVLTDIVSKALKVKI
jgi:succinyl-CoA synthetase beta subunit